MLRILVVDDNDVDRERIRRLLPDHEIVEAATALAGVDIARRDELDCVLLDNRLPDKDGVDVIEEFVRCSTPVLLLTSRGSESVAVEAMKRGAADYLPKSNLGAERLSRAIETAIERQHLQTEIVRRDEALQRALDELEHRSAKLEASHRALVQREAHLRIVQAQFPAILWTTDHRVTVTSMGGAVLRSLDVDPVESVGRSLVDVMHGAQGIGRAVSAHVRALEGTPAHYTQVLGGRTFECSVEPLRDPAARIVGVAGVGVDVTQTRTFEHRLQHVARLEALGKLTGGIAHDFNNILTAIIGFGTFARSRLDAGHPAYDDLGEALRAAQQAADLVRQLLTFSREDAPSLEAVGVTDGIRELLPLLRRLIGEDVELRFTHGEDSTVAMIGSTRLEQILVNLVVNARDAMPTGGVIAIDVREVVLRPGEEPIELPRGRYVRLSVRDDGEGISADTLPHIFEPFFTTKDVGEGTGLGLSTTFGIVRQAGGTVGVDSEVGVGTQFTVHLPRAHLDPATAPTDERLLPAERKARVLIVEDDDAVRSVAERTLRNLGYDVLVTDSGEAALAVSRTFAGEIHVVLTDVVMAGMSGPELAAAIAADRPNVAVVFMTGYPGSSDPPGQPTASGARIVAKPLLPSVLATTLRAALRSGEDRDEQPRAS